MSKVVMVVDDDDMMLNLVEIMLNRLEVRVVKVSSGEDALELLESVKPDIFVVDIMMPGMDGYELSRRLRARPETADHPIVILSARSDPESITYGFTVGANAWVSKLTVYTELPAAIEKLLNPGSSAIQ
jgi:CheY-like chemotaxis protein